jgi:hypothetical protein
MSDRDRTRRRLLRQFERALADHEREAWTRLLTATADLDPDAIEVWMADARARNRAAITKAIDGLLTAQERT